jgi:hypothetical protein
MGVGQYDFLKNVQPSTDTVLNNLTVNKITTLDDTQLVGDIVSHTYKATLTALQNYTLLSGFSLALNLPNIGLLPADFCDVDIYELVYLGRDPRAGDNLVQMSASLLIPKTTSRKYITSYKHGFIAYNNPSYTVNESLKLYATGQVTISEFISLGLIGYGTGTSGMGSITVISDMIGWGVTRGATVSTDKDANVQSEVGAIVATRKLILLNPNGIFDQFYTLTNPVTSVDALLIGYSMGAISGPSRAAELIQNQDEYKINVKLLKTDGYVPPTSPLYLATGVHYPIKSTTTTFIPNGLYIPLSICLLPVTGFGTSWDTAIGGVLDNIYKPVILNFLTARNTLYNNHTLPIELYTNLFKFLYDLAYYISNYLEYDSGGNVIPPWLNFPAVQPSLDPANAGYYLTLPMNMYYIFKKDAHKYNQIVGNQGDYNSLSNVPTSNLGGIPIVSICSNLDEVVSIIYANTSGGTVYTPNTIPQLFKSYCTGTTVANNKNFMFSGFVADPSNVGYYLPDSTYGSVWYQNNQYMITPTGAALNPYYQQVVVPTTIARDVSKYSEDLNTTVNTTQACNDIADAIIASIGTDNCKLYMANTTGLSYSSHQSFSVYTNLCVDTLIVKGYNP